MTGGVRNREISSRLWPSGVRIMAISTRWSRSPVTRPAHSPSTVARPSSSSPSSARTASAKSKPGSRRTRADHSGRSRSGGDGCEEPMPVLGSERRSNMIIGAHSIIYSRDGDADRAFLRDVLGFPHVDVGEGWLIFGLPPSEVAVHPGEENGVHELYLMTDDVEALVAEMTKR